MMMMMMMMMMTTVMMMMKLMVASTMRMCSLNNKQFFNTVYVTVLMRPAPLTHNSLPRHSNPPNVENPWKQDKYLIT